MQNTAADQVVNSSLDSYFSEDNRLEYRYISNTSCTVVEGCIDKAGWRRVLKFTTTFVNVGDEPLFVGNIVPSSPFLVVKCVIL